MSNHNHTPFDVADPHSSFDPFDRDDDTDPLQPGLPPRNPDKSDPLDQPITPPTRPSRIPSTPAWATKQEVQQLRERVSELEDALEALLDQQPRLDTDTRIQLYHEHDHGPTVGMERDP